MAEKDVVITYETLFELLRIEKTREDIQKLNPSFFDDVLVYVGEKKALFNSHPSETLLFDFDEKEKTKLELDNIKRILRELYDRREKKIISSAINKAKTGAVLINTGNLLPSERLLFDSISMVLFEFRKNILHKLASGELPVVSGLHGSIISNFNTADAAAAELASMPKETTDAADNFSSGAVADAFSSEVHTGIAGNDEDNASDMHFKASNEPKDLKITPNSSEIGANIKKIRFLAPIGEIVGPDLQIYGPYTEGTVTSLPVELARVLVEKRQAEDVQY